MSGKPDDVLAIVQETLRRCYRDNGLQGEIGPETRLFGKNALLDSLQLVSFIVDVEAEVNAAFHASATLADEKAMSRSQSPFRSVRTLADYVVELLGPSAKSGS